MPLLLNNRTGNRQKAAFWLFHAFTIRLSSTTPKIKSIRNRQKTFNEQANEVSEREREREMERGVNKINIIYSVEWLTFHSINRERYWSDVYLLVIPCLSKPCRSCINLWDNFENAHFAIGNDVAKRKGNWERVIREVYAGWTFRQGKCYLGKLLRF